MNSTVKLIALIAFLAFTHQSMAQDTNVASHQVTINIPEIALLDIEPSNSSIQLTASAPSEAGNPLSFTGATNNSLWLNYSSIIGAAPDDNRKITVSATGTLPMGADLRVLASAVSGNGAGTRGTPTGQVTISSTGQGYDIITGIGSCYTGNGVQNGHQLTYSLVENSANYGNLRFDTNYSLTITYTLSDN